MPTMLPQLKNERRDENARGTHRERRTSIYLSKQSTINLKNSAMKKRINDLEEEVENLRTTVKFYQDIYLLNE
jgi:hypothetical protein